MCKKENTVAGLVNIGWVKKECFTTFESRVLFEPFLKPSARYKYEEDQGQLIQFTSEQSGRLFKQHEGALNDVFIGTFLFFTFHRLYISIIDQLIFRSSPLLFCSS